MPCLPAGTLLPAAARMAKRSPDPSLFVLAHLLAAGTPDLSGAPAAELFPTLLQQARHAKEPIRCGGWAAGGGGGDWRMCGHR